MVKIGYKVGAKSKKGKYLPQHRGVFKTYPDAKEYGLKHFGTGKYHIMKKKVTWWNNL